MTCSSFNYPSQGKLFHFSKGSGFQSRDAAVGKGHYRRRIVARTVSGSLSRYNAADSFVAMRDHGIRNDVSSIVGGREFACSLLDAEFSHRDRGENTR
ncbi:MAG: hypothetical protein Q8L23_15355 [Caulobacter sp.]|nr:hypothetical protein [Caulobacter sp.]